MQTFETGSSYKMFLISAAIFWLIITILFISRLSGIDDLIFPILSIIVLVGYAIEIIRSFKRINVDENGISTIGRAENYLEWSQVFGVEEIHAFTVFLDGKLLTVTLALYHCVFPPTGL